MQIEIISSDQMLDCYSSNGLPIHYFHWSFGKRHLAEAEQYKKGQINPVSQSTFDIEIQQSEKKYNISPVSKIHI